MDLEGKVFVFDYEISCVDGEAFAVLKVNKGILEECFNPLDHNDCYLGNEEDELAIKYLKDNNINEVYTTSYIVRNPTEFLGINLWYVEELTDPDLVPGQCFFYSYQNLYGERLKELKKQGIDVIIIDPKDYLTEPEKPINTQLEFSF